MSDTMTTAQAIENDEGRKQRGWNAQVRIELLRSDLSRLDPATPNDYHALQQWADRLPLASRDLFWQDIQRVIGRQDGDGPATTDHTPIQMSRQEWEGPTWQPIDTHDKDDRELNLVALIRDGVIWRVSEARDTGLGWYSKSGEACHWRTHWMPLTLPLSASPTPDEKTTYHTARFGDTVRVTYDGQPPVIIPAVPSALPATVLDPYFASALEEIRKRPYQGTGSDVPVLLAIVDALLSALAQKETK